MPWPGGSSPLRRREGTTWWLMRRNNIRPLRETISRVIRPDTSG